jgi:CBS domain-containing protein
MTAGVISVDPDTSVQALAALLSEHGISGVPVVDSANRVVGVIGESDLIPHSPDEETILRPLRQFWVKIQ